MTEFMKHKMKTRMTALVDKKEAKLKDEFYICLFINMVSVFNMG